MNTQQFSFETIEVSMREGLATLTLNRPDRLNSFNTQMHAEVREFLAAVKSDSSVRCLLITANGRGFCAGQDLSDRAVSADQAAPDLSESIKKNYNPLVRTLVALDMPVICAVNGVAAGAGANIALACDLVLAAKSAKFIQPFNKLGLVPDSGGTWVLPRLVGQAMAMRLTLLGEPVSAERALELGMICEVCEDDALLDTAKNLGLQLAKGPTKGLALAKRAIRESASNSFDQQLDLERDLQGEAGRTDDYREGVAAFMEKREPNYRGS